MPDYAYKCERCGYTTDVHRSMHENEIAPFCGDCCQQMIRVWSAPEITFKGSGFYKTDNRR